jgi:hypothetical protein
MIATTDHKRYRSVPKSFEDNIKMPISPTNQMKRKLPLTNSDIIHTTTKKLDTVKSIEFEPREKDESILNLTDNHNNTNFDRG